jgi:succinate dehydrogenase/fumarate reductase iron-sulfur protein
LRIFRYDPGSDEAPRYESYAVPYKKHMRILDALNYVYDELGDGLAYRWYCGIKKCGECSLTVNGKPVLPCWEPAVDDMTCEPLTNFPIVRDLVVDRSEYERIILDLVPFVRRSRNPRFPEKISHDKMEPSYRLSKCIECDVCSAAVPVKRISAQGIDWAGYSGPTALVKFAMFAFDPRDEMDRTGLAAQSGLRDFPLYPVLAEICPQGIDILQDTLVPLKRKFFHLEETDHCPVQSAAVFVKGPDWSAFVRLTDEQKKGLIEEGTLKAEPLPGIDEAYSLIVD